MFATETARRAAWGYFLDTLQSPRSQADELQLALKGISGESSITTRSAPQRTVASAAEPVAIPSPVSSALLEGIALPAHSERLATRLAGVECARTHTLPTAVKVSAVRIGAEDARPSPGIFALSRGQTYRTCQKS